MSTKNSKGLRAGLRALTNPMNLPDFAPGEYDEGWEPTPGKEFGWDPEQGLIERESVRGPFRHDLPNFYTVPAAQEFDPAPFLGWGDEDLTPLQPLELDERRFNWRNFRFYALAFTGLVLSQTLIALAVDASR